MAYLLGSRIGRQPNAIKHATFLEIKQLSTNHSLPKEAETVKLGDHLNESAEAKTSPKQAIGKTAENEYSQVVILDAWKNMIEELLMVKFRISICRFKEFLKYCVPNIDIFIFMPRLQREHTSI